MAFTPVTINPLQAWLQTVIPVVYDDSLSYLEFLGKVMAKMNELIASDAAQSAALQEFLATFEGDLTQTVADYLDVWKDDGTIQAILTASLNEFTDALDAHKLEVEGALDALETDLEGQISTLNSDVDALQLLVGNKLMLNVKDYGAVGNGVVDDTSAFSAAITAAAAAGATLYAPAGTYNITPIAVTCSMLMDPKAWLKFIGATAADIVTTSGNDLILSLNIDADLLSPRLMIFNTGARNHFLSIRLKNLSAQDGLGLANTKAGFADYGPNTIIDFIQVKNFQNNGHINRSMPQAVAFVTGSDNAKVKRAIIEDGACAVVTQNTGKRTFIDELIVNTVSDNGIYVLEGELNVNSMIHSGEDEAIVVLDRCIINYVNILKCVSGVLCIQGNSLSSLAVINEVHITNGLGGAYSNVMKARTGNTLFGRVYIGAITGEFRGNTLINSTIGEIDELVVNNVQVTYNYVQANGNIGNFFRITGIRSFTLRNWNVIVIDEANTLTSGDTLQFWATTEPTRHSFLEDVQINAYNSDRITKSALVVRLIGFNKSLVHFKGIAWQVNAGPDRKSTRLNSSH